MHYFVLAFINVLHSNCEVTELDVIDVQKSTTWKSKTSCLAITTCLCEKECICNALHPSIK